MSSKPTKTHLFSQLNLKVYMKDLIVYTKFCKNDKFIPLWELNSRGATQKFWVERLSPFLRKCNQFPFLRPDNWIEYEFFFPMIYNLGICSVGTLKSKISFPVYHTKTAFSQLYFRVSIPCVQ